MKHGPGGGQVLGNPEKLESPPPVRACTRPVGHAPFTAMPDDAPAPAAYSPTTAATVPEGSDSSAPMVAGSVRNPTLAGVSCRVPNGRPTRELSNGVTPKLSSPMLETPVSCRRVTS